MPWTEAQMRLWRAAAHDPEIARRHGISQSRAREFMREGVKRAGGGVTRIPAIPAAVAIPLRHSVPAGGLSILSPQVRRRASGASPAPAVGRLPKMRLGGLRYLLRRPKR